MRGFGRLIAIHLNVSTAYFNKVQPHLFEQNAMARYYRESSMLNERVFEEIGQIATIGLSQLFFGYYPPTPGQSMQRVISRPRG